jgi:hypothetical protein
MRLKSTYLIWSFSGNKPFRKALSNIMRAVLLDLKVVKLRNSTAKSYHACSDEKSVVSSQDMEAIPTVPKPLLGITKLVPHLEAVC